MYKFRYQAADQLGKLIWCWLFILLFIGGVLQLEDESINYWAISIIGLSLILMGFISYRCQLKIDLKNHHLKIRGIFNAGNRSFSFQQIQQINLKRHMCVITLKDKGYFPIKLLVSKKSQKILRQI
ncbi:EbsA family protein [Bombilactobacillus folatiphilus]|uniref:EbsA family protein n=1 Tax=Bombilactobacillus folatiphilus TaxID=2923362 RepID=A0ABY4P7B7_9LACO|nr:EbsA family protein [Bombilactobacillus folatiphilus]UQS81475.1 EbsA family protein [Bombilactobacillus folatiphilus]